LSEQWTAKDAGMAIRACLFAMIWIAYFRRSERVRRTFVRRLGHGQAGAAQSASASPA
jgi:hypothetical protein